MDEYFAPIHTYQVCIVPNPPHQAELLSPKTNEFIPAAKVVDEFLSSLLVRSVT